MLAEYEETIKFYEQKTKGLEADNVSLLAALQEKDSEAAAALLELKEEHLTAQVATLHLLARTRVCSVWSLPLGAL
jgi:hypothetical protein